MVKIIRLGFVLINGRPKCSVCVGKRPRMVQLCFSTEVYCVSVPVIGGNFLSLFVGVKGIESGQLIGGNRQTNYFHSHSHCKLF